jgi:hypothetical protein
MELFRYKFTDLFDYSSPSMEMWLAPTELLEFANIIAQHMLAAHPDLIDKGICVTVYPVSMVPLDTVH